VLYPVFLARKRMVTRVLAMTTKVKSNFIIFSETIVRTVLNLRKNSFYLFCKSERQKVQVTNRNLSLRTFSFFSSAANSVGTSLKSAAFGSGRYAK